jgi:hypothetical protein
VSRNCSKVGKRLAFRAPCHWRRICCNATDCVAAMNSPNDGIGAPLHRKLALLRGDFQPGGAGHATRLHKVRAAA